MDVLLAVAAIVAAPPCCRAAAPITVANSQIELRINGENGDIESFVHRGRELIRRVTARRSLFTVRLRDTDGAPVDLTALSAESFAADRATRGDGQEVVLTYKRLNGRPVDATVTVRLPNGSAMTYWRLSLRNGTGMLIDHIDFPTVVVPNDLVAKGGDARLFWPAMEGAVIEDIRLRERSPLKYRPIEHPQRGWRGVYPGACPMQFMAYYGEAAGLYLAAHDDQSHPKGVEFHRHRRGGIHLDFRLFPGVGYSAEYQMPFDMVLGGFEGDWYDAADIYRNWRDSSNMPRPPRLADNPDIPEWFEASPVVVTYAVRGERDRGDMSPNEYFPYTRALDPLCRLGGEMDAPILALLMHWEGSAPWAPPYVWPPYGGTEDFGQFVKGLHDKGHLLGLYASGVAYTTTSNTDPSYSMEEEFVEQRVFNYSNVAPDMTLAENGVCVGPNGQRRGYDLCPANPWVQDVVVDEIAKVLPSGVDYLQYFDQNLGGCCSRCYARHHGHPPAPGPWQNAAMSRIYARANEKIAESGKKVLIGCESAAGEPFVPHLLFNDLRFNINLRFAVPVPAYAYLNHEYVNNFMGNQNSTRACVDYARSPLNLNQRLAYAFTAGDMMTVVLRGGGKIGWDWGTPWDTPGPDHDAAATLVRNLNAWRTGAGKPYLVYGRMLKPLKLEGLGNLPMTTPKGAKLNFPSLFTSRWTSSGKSAQVVVNYTPSDQTCAIIAQPGRTVQFHAGPLGAAQAASFDQDGRLPLEVPRLSAVMVEFAEPFDTAPETENQR
ncbi:MAG: DUF6259 domain-containing protein [Planctomycetota bacterium]